MTQPRNPDWEPKAEHELLAAYDEAHGWTALPARRALYPATGWGSLPLRLA